MNRVRQLMPQLAHVPRESMREVLGQELYPCDVHGIVCGPLDQGGLHELGRDAEDHRRYPPDASRGRGEQAGCRSGQGVGFVESSQIGFPDQMHSLHHDNRRHPLNSWWVVLMLIRSHDIGIGQLSIIDAAVKTRDSS